MNISDIHGFFERWAPQGVAWERDNPGLQVGNMETRVRGILVALDPEESVVEEAARRGANLLITHHPLLFHPLRRVDQGERAGRCITALLRRRVALYSAHTNVDWSPGGTNTALARELGIADPVPLRTPFRRETKVVTFVPEGQVRRVAEAMAAQGAGRIGNYSECSFRLSGRGTFRGNRRSAPAVGRRGNLEEVEETRLEMVVPEHRVRDVLDALRRTHPYEEPACDVYPLATPTADFGMGLVGHLKGSLTVRRFLSRIRTRISVRRIRYSPGAGSMIRSVALCGGSGSELLEDAVRAGADAFVTADVPYHRFREAEGRIVLVDAGHYETERPVVGALVAKVGKFAHARGGAVPVAASAVQRNPVRYL